MNDIDDAVKEALKRVDHLIYVSLKYTKTVDVIRNAILRLLEACDLIIIEGLEYKKKKKKIKAIPSTPQERADMLYKVFKKKTVIKQYLEFFHLLRRIKVSNYNKQGEYRKNVAMIVIDEKYTFLEIDYEALKAYNAKTHEFVNFMRDWIETGKEN